MYFFVREVIYIYFNLDERYTAVENIDIISTPLNNLYKCGDNTSVKVKDVDVTIANVTLIAFNTEKKIATKSGKDRFN